MGLYGHDIYISFFFREGSLSFNLIYSMLNFCLEDFVLFLFVLLNKQTIWTWTILKYKLCIICKSYVTVHILRPKVKSRYSFEVWIILSLRNKYLQVILHDTVWFTMMYNPQVYVLHMGYPNYSSINENLSMSNCKNLKK